MSLLLLMVNYGLYAQTKGLSWHLVKEDKDISIYDADSAGSIKKFKAEFTIRRPAGEVVDFLKKVEDFSWLEGVDKVELLKSLSDTQYTYKFFIRREFMFGAFSVKKDAVAHSVVHHKPGYYYLESNIDRSFPKTEGYDRLEHYQVKWYVIPAEHYTSKLVYEGLIDVEVAFAYPIIKAFITTSMVDSFSNMKQLLENRSGASN